MAWRKKSEGLNPLWITKGKLAVTGGRMAHFKVALSGRGVALCHQYQGCLDGKRFASMVHKIFPDIYKKTEHCEGRLLLQDGCLVEISAAGLKAMKKVKADVFSIPLRSPDFNPIEYFFNLILKKLNDDALENMITFESIEEVSIKEVDKIIKSMHNRIKKILQRKGQRLNLHEISFSLKLKSTVQIIYHMKPTWKQHEAKMEAVNFIEWWHETTWNHNYFLK